MLSLYFSELGRIDARNLLESFEIVEFPMLRSVVDNGFGFFGRQSHLVLQAARVELVDRTAP